MKQMSKGALNTLIVVLIAATLVSLSVYAWFYFPTSQKVNLSTADKKDLEIHLYKMDLDGINYRFIEVDPPENSSSITLSHVWSFFQWGDEYILENDDEQLFAIECICDTDVFESGKIKLVMNINMLCTSDDMNEVYSQHHGKIEEAYALIKFVDISYHVINTDISSYNITSPEASIQAQNQEDFTPISLIESDSISSSSSLTFTGEDEYIYHDYSIVDDFGNPIVVKYYTQTIGEVPDTTERFRSVILLKITADQEMVSNAMNEYSRTVTGFDDLSELDLFNHLTLTCSLRTVPEKTE